MKILSKKKWEKINQLVVDLQMDLANAKEDNKTYYNQVEYLRNIVTNQKEENDKLLEEIEKLKKRTNIPQKGIKNTPKKVEQLKLDKLSEEDKKVPKMAKKGVKKTNE